MAVLYVFPVGEYIQLNDQNNEYLTTIHYSEFSFGIDTNSNIQFSHRRDTDILAPIRATTFAEVLQANGTPYNTVDLDSFVSAFSAVLPMGSGGSSSPAATLVQKTINGATEFSTAVGAKEIQVIALAGTFGVIDSSGDANSVTYPVATVGGGTIATFYIKSTAGESIAPLNISIPLGASVLYFEKK